MCEVDSAVGGTTVVAGDVAVVVQLAHLGEVPNCGLRNARVVNGNEGSAHD